MNLSLKFLPPFGSSASISEGVGDGVRLIDLEISLAALAGRLEYGLGLELWIESELRCSRA